MSTMGRPVARLSGYAPAIPTPFNEDGSLDQNALEQICERQIRLGADALVVCGTSGEAPTLSPAEHATIVRAAVSVSRGRGPGGGGSRFQFHSTRHRADRGGRSRRRRCHPVGCALLQQAHAGRPLCPFPRHRPIDRTADHRLRCSVPDGMRPRRRNGCPIGGDGAVHRPEDATGDISRPARLRPLVGPDFRLLSGDDATALAFFAMGGDGCISVTSNVAPRLCGDMFRAFSTGRVAGAQRLGQAVALLTAALFRETNPVPLKYALSLFGLMSPKVRLPLVELSLQTEAQVARVVMQISDMHPDSDDRHYRRSPRLIGTRPRQPEI